MSRRFFHILRKTRVGFVRATFYAKTGFFWENKAKKWGILTEVKGKLYHFFSKNILTKRKQYATMVATSGNRDVRKDDFDCLKSRAVKRVVFRKIIGGQKKELLLWQVRKLVA